ncbi:unnamed protein product [Bursaphelenchus xylophilus]|uniref:(pine wood nematode) hypothetical protein n=1 Tax=Bursaphelenchus xylophilus TaxID=6326 RepID=A0A1I7RRJ0_BURXY|nr:unnamed protein product [Bursaphelenchus xylophilus]CAG9131074.1 unnamed protein product [Bursaphelenchus xylophilus]
MAEHVAAKGSLTDSLRNLDLSVGPSYQDQQLDGGSESAEGGVYIAPDLNRPVESLGVPFANHVRTVGRASRLSSEPFMYLMDSLSIRMVKTFAMASPYYLHAVQRYFADFRCLNVNLNLKKYCLSKKDPCNCVDRMCGDRVIRKVKTWVDFFHAGIVHVDFVYIKATKEILQKHHFRAVEKLMKEVSGVKKIFLELSQNNAPELARIVHDLCEKSQRDDLFVYVKDASIDNFTMNIPPFFPAYTNRLVFTNDGFPELRCGECKKFLVGNDLHQYERDAGRKRRSFRISRVVDEMIDDWMHEVIFDDIVVHNDPREFWLEDEEEMDLF